MSRRASLAVLAAALLSSVPSGAAPVVETVDRLEVNWGTLKIRAYGEAAAAGAPEEALKAAERQAWQDGLNYIQSAVRDLNVTSNEGRDATPDKLGEDAREAARQVAKSTQSLITTYFGDGRVRVQLENQLPKALSVSGLRFRQKETASHGALEHSGILLKLDKAVKPTARYQVVDETGATLYDVREMAEEAYRKNLMGRWFRRPSPGEVSEAVGKNAVTVPVEVVGPGVFRVNREAWEKAIDGHRSLLVNGTVALALP